jgi:hypothetical protein
MEAVRSSKTEMNLYRATRRYVTEGSALSFMRLFPKSKDFWKNVSGIKRVTFFSVTFVPNSFPRINI